MAKDKECTKLYIAYINTPLSSNVWYEIDPPKEGEEYQSIESKGHKLLGTVTICDKIMRMDLATKKVDSIFLKRMQNMITAINSKGYYEGYYYEPKKIYITNKNFVQDLRVREFNHGYYYTIKPSYGERYLKEGKIVLTAKEFLEAVENPNKIHFTVVDE